MPVVLIEKHSPQVTVLTLNRPERRNALSIQLLSELVAAIKVASDEPRERILILRGAGAAFCTGLDLKEAADQTKAHAAADMVARTLVALSQTRLVTLAAAPASFGSFEGGEQRSADFRGPSRRWIQRRHYDRLQAKIDGFGIALPTTVTSSA